MCGVPAEQRGEVATTVTTAEARWVCVCKCVRSWLSSEGRWPPQSPPQRRAGCGAGGGVLVCMRVVRSVRRPRNHRARMQTSPSPLLPPLPPSRVQRSTTIALNHVHTPSFSPLLRFTFPPPTQPLDDDDRALIARMQISSSDALVLLSPHPSLPPCTAPGRRRPRSHHLHTHTHPFCPSPHPPFLSVRLSYA